VFSEKDDRFLLNSVSAKIINNVHGKWKFKTKERKNIENTTSCSGIGLAFGFFCRLKNDREDNA